MIHQHGISAGPFIEWQKVGVGRTLGLPIGQGLDPTLGQEGFRDLGLEIL